MNARILVSMSSILTLGACSLLLDRRADQCSTDGDCARFASTRCDQNLRLCVVVADTPDSGTPPPKDSSTGEDGGAADAVVDASGEPCVGPNGCYQCAPSTELQFVNGCTDAQCKPFDNRARIKRLPPDGGLTPLPEREAGRP